MGTYFGITVWLFCLLYWSDAFQFSTNHEKFSYKLYQKISAETKNDFVLSPFSARTGLVIAYIGARGQTALELQNVLHLTGNKSSTIETFKDLLHPLQNENSALKVANKIFVHNKIEVNDTYNTIVTNQLFTSVERLEFKNPSKAARMINRYVANKTNSLIKDLIEPSLLTPDTQVVLVNAVYFKSVWHHPFKTRSTRKELFYTGATSSVLVDTMHLISMHLQYADLPEFDAKLVGLMFQGGFYSFHVLIPNERTGLSKLEESLTNIDLSTFSERLEFKYLALSMPKFKTEFRVFLNDPLKELGINTAFTGSADFGDMLIDARNVGISDVVHQAYINVEEGGTEAAAATGIGVRRSKSRVIRPQLPVEIRIDHPFIYYIEDNSHGNVFFIGRYAGTSL